MPEAAPEQRLARLYNGRMNAAIQPLQLIPVSIAGWIGRRQLEVIEYLLEENRVMKEQLGGRRLRQTAGASASAGAP